MEINNYFNKMFSYENEELIQSPILTQKLAPTFTIVTTTETKLYCKINYTTDDGLVEDIIKSSHFFVESQIQKCIAKQSWEQKQSGGCSKIVLCKAPIIGTPTVTIYDDFDSAGEVLPTTSVRIVDNVLFHVDNFFENKRDGDGYKIEFDCGLFTSSTATTDYERSTIRNIILRLSAYLYENRQMYCQSYNQENWTINYSYFDLPHEIRRMLNPLRQNNLGIL